VHRLYQQLVAGWRAPTLEGRTAFVEMRAQPHNSIFTTTDDQHKSHSESKKVKFSILVLYIMLIPLLTHSTPRFSHQDRSATCSVVLARFCCWRSLTRSLYVSVLPPYRHSTSRGQLTSRTCIASTWRWCRWDNRFNVKFDVHGGRPFLWFFILLWLCYLT
jgi:hypothetical protein